MDHSFQIAEAKKSLHKFLNRCLLQTIDDEIFLSQDAETEDVDLGGPVVSTLGKPMEPFDRFMFTDSILIQEILNHPTGGTEKTWEWHSATTHGGHIFEKAESWYDEWWEKYTNESDIDDIDELLDAFEEAGLTDPLDWYGQLDGTLAELRVLCAD